MILARLGRENSDDICISTSASIMKADCPGIEPGPRQRQATD